MTWRIERDDEGAPTRMVWDERSWTCIGFFGTPAHDQCKRDYCGCECHRTSDSSEYVDGRSVDG